MYFYALIILVWMNLEYFSPITEKPLIFKGLDRFIPPYIMIGCLYLFLFCKHF